MSLATRQPAPPHEHCPHRGLGGRLVRSDGIHCVETCCTCGMERSRLDTDELDPAHGPYVGVRRPRTIYGPWKTVTHVSSVAEIA